LAQFSPSYQTVPLYLDVNPQRHHDNNIGGGDDTNSAWVSHMINDGAKIHTTTTPVSSSSSSSNDRAEKQEETILNYYHESGLKRNCVHIPWGPSPIIATVTTKKVKKGQELFTTYGGTYWLGSSSSGSNDSTSTGKNNNEAIVTTAIQTKIQETVQELLRSMQTVSVTYAQQVQALETEFQNLK